MTQSPLIAAACAALALAGCTYNTAPPPRPPMIAGTAVAVMPDGTGSVLTPVTVVGLTAVAPPVALQAADLRQALAGRDVTVIEEDGRILLRMPETVAFAPGATTAEASLSPILSDLAASLARWPASSLRIIGHTDNVGGEEFTRGLSLERARMMAEMLMADGVAPGRMSITGQGASRPLASNYSIDGRARNRRMEILITPFSG